MDSEAVCVDVQLCILIRLCECANLYVVIDVCVFVYSRLRT